MAGLERTARLAGESFGHEETAATPRLRPISPPSARWLWLIVALAALAGLAVTALR